MWVTIFKKFYQSKNTLEPFSRCAAGGLDWDLYVREALLSRLFILSTSETRKDKPLSLIGTTERLCTCVTAPLALGCSDGDVIVNVTSNLSLSASLSDRRANGVTVRLGYVPGLSSLSGWWLANELGRVIVNDNTSENRRVVLFALSALPRPGLVHHCGDYSRCITTWFNRAWFCLHSQAAQCSRVLSSNRRSCPDPFVIPAVHWKRLQSGGMGGKKINAVKCGDRKMSFWQMQGFVYAQIEFWWISPQARSPFLIYKPSYKNVKQWCYRKQIQMSSAQKVPRWTWDSFLFWKCFLSKIDRHLKLFWKTHVAIFRKMLHELYFDTVCHSAFACVTSMQMNLH